MITASGSDNSSGASTVVMPKVPATTDTHGRLRVSKAQRRDLLAAPDRSGESLPRFARRTGLKYSTLANWVQHRRRAKDSVRPPRLRLLEAVVESAQVAAAGSPLVLRLPGGAHLEVADEKQAALAAALLRALEHPATSC